MKDASLECKLPNKDTDNRHEEEKGKKDPTCVFRPEEEAERFAEG